jgi:hypothetical protein
MGVHIDEGRPKVAALKGNAGGGIGRGAAGEKPRNPALIN